MSSAGKVIQEWRLRSGITQDDVAAELGVTEGAVSQWETGRTTPTKARALRLDRMLGAGGKIVAACGYVVSADPDDEITRLSGQLAAQQRQLDVLTTRLAALTETVQGLTRELASVQTSTAADG